MPKGNNPLRVAIFGGAGVFGSRLSELALRDGHQVWIVARSDRSSDIATQLGCNFLKLGHMGDLSALEALSIDCVIDAAGPFHGYGEDPYRLAKWAIAHGVHYFDLSDDAAFCIGISELDVKARAAGVSVISGLSTVPAISSAVTADLAVGIEVDTIDVAILPGNRAPRGRSVIESILSQAGRSFNATRGGQTVPVRSWSERRLYALTKSDIRAAWLIEVPDNRLFPSYFNAKTVLFRAGLELGVMSWGLACFSWCRSLLGFQLKPWMVKLVLLGANLLAPFGTDTGGMVVEVTGRKAAKWVKRIWVLRASQGDGPYVPAIAARACLRQINQLDAGARAAVGVVPRRALEDAMADLAITFEQSEHQISPLFEQVLGSDLAALPNAVRDSHQTVGAHSYSGTAQILRGADLWSRVIAFVFRFPKAAQHIPVQVRKIRVGTSEVWTRRFGNQVFRSTLAPQEGRMTERFGPFKFVLDLHVKDNALQFPVLSGKCLGVPMPSWLLPQSIASEREKDGLLHFDVKLRAPIAGSLIVHYKGVLEQD